jgi:hypothetical protein
MRRAALVALAFLTLAACGGDDEREAMARTTPTALEELAECLDDPECAAELGEQLEQGATTVAEEEDPNAAFTEEAKDVQTDVIEAVRKEPGFNLDAAIESGYGSEVERHCRRSAAPLGASSQKYSTTTAR